MPTLAQLADRAQLTLNDSAAGTWPQATVEAWCIDAIRDYSQAFPRTRALTISVSGASPGHEFNLTTDTIDIVQVEYPQGEDPPVYLKRRHRTHPLFYRQTGYYDFELLHDSQEYSILYLSEEPADGDTIAYLAKCHHDVTLSSGDDITVPVEHESLLILYVLWQAFKERLATEQQDPDTTLAGAVTLLQQLVKGATQAEAEYRRALQRALQARSESGATGPWTVDDHDRIY
ncbi:MAG: hypothetical protein ACK2U2_09635 [Anaerolineae bacterium]|jgi:hypothetical protein